MQRIYGGCVWQSVLGFLIVFMVCDMAMSAAALSRYEERSHGIASQTALQSCWMKNIMMKK